MKNLIRLEETALFCISIFLFTQLDFAWWWFPLLLLVPDIGMAGYAIDKKVGAYFYNFVHHRGIGIIIYLIGAFAAQQVLQLAGIILFAHSTIDRVFGFGLKYADDFKHTHLSSWQS